MQQNLENNSVGKSNQIPLASLSKKWNQKLTIREKVKGKGKGKVDFLIIFPFISLTISIYNLQLRQVLTYIQTISNFFVLCKFKIERESFWICAETKEVHTWEVECCYWCCCCCCCTFLFCLFVFDIITPLIKISRQQTKEWWQYQFQKKYI